MATRKFHPAENPAESTSETTAVTTPATPAKTGMVKRIVRPSGFVIAGLLMFLPFITVSCDVPGGFGQAAPGGTTKYTGIDLVVGGAPTIDPPDKIREGAPELIGPQPLAIFVVLLLIAGIVITTRVRTALTRRACTALLSGVTAVSLIIAQLLVQEELSQRVPAKYVHTQPGFWLCLSMLVVVMFANAIAWLRSVPDS